ncbi:MAG: hypothetical protein IPI73_25140 [Betaproteobacteria bacterium]|nr:hypothetical protein [Betaproteobacteria bacterium]
MLPFTSTLSSVNPFTVAMWMPALQFRFVPAPRLAHVAATSWTDCALLVKFMFVSVMLLALTNSAPRVVVFWMVPPVPAVVPVPVTVNAPLEPVVLRMIPLAPPLAEMLRKVSPLAPMVVLATFSAVPVVVASVLTMLVLFWVALTVPPPVAVKAGLAPVLRFMPPVKLMVPPVLLVSEMPPVAFVIERHNRPSRSNR